MDADERAYRRDIRRLAVKAADLAAAVLEGRVTLVTEMSEQYGRTGPVIPTRVRVVVEPRPGGED